MDRQSPLKSSPVTWVPSSFFILSLNFSQFLENAGNDHNWTKISLLIQTWWIEKLEILCKQILCLSDYMHSYCWSASRINGQQGRPLTDQFMQRNNMIITTLHCHDDSHKYDGDDDDDTRMSNFENNWKLIKLSWTNAMILLISAPSNPIAANESLSKYFNSTAIFILWLFKILVTLSIFETSAFPKMFATASSMPAKFKQNC